MNILEIARGYFNKEVIGTLAQSTGENTTVVQNALGAVLPSVRAGIMEKGATAEGVKGLISLLKLNDSEDSVLNIFTSGQPKNGQFDSLMTSGSAIMEALFGRKTAKVEDAVSQQSGIGKVGASVLLNVAAPVLLSVVGKFFKEGGMGASGLINMLMGQKEAVLSSLPLGLSSVLDFAKLGDYRGNEQTARRETYEYDDRRGKSKSGMPGWLYGLLGGLLLIAGIWLFKTCKSERQAISEVAGGSADSLASGLTEMADTLATKVGAGVEALGAFFKRKLPNGIELNIPEFGVENKLVSFIEDQTKSVDKTTWFNFDRINFETGSAKLSEDSKEQTVNIAEILNAFPNVSVKIGGYTDNTGDEQLNLKLSQSRADAVKAAIIAQGIQAERIEAEGFGKEHPVANNDTEEGRAQNRRIAIRVTHK